MGGLQYIIPIRTVHENSPSSNFFYSPLHDAAERQTRKSNKILGYESGDWGSSIHEKNQRSKTWRYCPFKTSILTVVTAGLSSLDATGEMDGAISFQFVLDS
jgi:hypothetical protein